MDNTPSGFIETMLVENGNIPLLQYHLQRIKGTCHALAAICDIETWQQECLDIIHANDIATTYILKSQFTLHAEKYTHWEFTTRKHIPLQQAALVGIYPGNLKKINQYSWIKSTERALYDEAMQYAHAQTWDDVIILNDKGNICESCIANILIERQGKFYYPSAEDGAVKGVYLQYLLAESSYPLEAATIQLSDLLDADALWLCNAVRGIFPIQIAESCHPLLTQFHTTND